MGDISGLMTKMKESNLTDQPEMMKRLVSGKMCLRDMSEQYVIISLWADRLVAIIYILHLVFSSVVSAGSRMY